MYCSTHQVAVLCILTSLQPQQGLATIRASEEQRQFIAMYNAYQDRNTSASYYYLAANRWLGYRLDIICASLMTIVTFAPFIAYEAGLGKC